MSTALALAATTRVLGSVLEQSIADAGVSSLLGSPPYVSARPPDQIEDGGNENAQLALFLYHVTYNQGWREERLPSRTGAGQVVDRPILAIDLHYLLVGYGKADYVQHLLLGIGMQALHENPVLYRQQIADVFTGPLGPLDSALAASGLENQVEQIKITPEPLTTDDLSKLWTAFGGKFRPSAGYLATTLLIEAEDPVAAPLPVAARNLAVIRLRRPVVDAVTPQRVAWSSSPGPALTLTGVNLSGAGTYVVFDNAPASPQPPQRVDAATSTVTVPPIPAGLNTFHVVQRMAVGAPPDKNVVRSQAAQFHLLPVIRRQATPPNEELITVGPLDTSAHPPTRTVTVELDPVMGPTQAVQLLLDEISPPPGQAPLSFTFAARPDQISPNSVDFDTYGTRPGAYLARVRVDGAESVLGTDSSGTFVRPVVTL
jgi:hypothetical protein